MSETKSVSEPEQSPPRWTIRWTEPSGETGLSCPRYATMAAALDAGKNLKQRFPTMTYQIVDEIQAADEGWKWDGSTGQMYRLPQDKKDPKSWAIKWTDAAGASGLGTSRWSDHPQAHNAALNLAAKFPGMRYQVFASSDEPNWRDGLAVDALGSLRPQSVPGGKFAAGMPVYALRVRYPDGKVKLGAAWTTRERARQCIEDVRRSYPENGYSLELHVGEPAPGYELLQPGLCRVIQEMPQPESESGLALADPGAGSLVMEALAQLDKHSHATKPATPLRWGTIKPDADELHDRAPQESVDPLGVKYDGVELRRLLAMDKVHREEQQSQTCAPPWWISQEFKFTTGQRAALSAHWSAQLRAKFDAAKEKERIQVVCDVWGNDD